MAEMSSLHTLLCQKYRNKQTHTHTHTPFSAQWCLNLPQYASLEGWLWWKLVQDHLREIFCVWKQWQRARWETARTEPESIPGAGSHDSHEAGLWRFSQSSVSRPHVWHVRPVSAACLFWLALVCHKSFKNAFSSHPEPQPPIFFTATQFK